VRQVESFFYPNAEQVLYHYTGIAGLMGIVDSRAIWASHAYYLNDSKEILHAVDVLSNKIERYVTLMGMEKDYALQLRTWLVSFRQTAYHIFVFSLSEERSLLSQWRSYTPHGKGVSVGFSTQTINNLLNSNKGFRLAKCLYTQDEHNTLLDSLMEKLLVTFRQGDHPALGQKAHPSQTYHPFFESFRNDFLQVLAIVKHEAFREEKEWRVLSPYYASYKGSQVQFRPGASMIMPYTVLDLPKQGVLFEQVVLGPSRDINLSHSALSTYMSNRGVCNVTFNSEIPYRQW
jgi:hypothetical protein